MKLADALAAVVGAEHLLPGTRREYLSDATDSRGIRGEAALVALPGTAQEVAAVMRACYEMNVPMVPRGGGTGFAGGAVPALGSVVISLERLRAVRALQPLQWRMHVEAGVLTAEVQRLARENGLYFPPDPGAAEQSQIGGNIATNAGGPHAFKYGVCSRWVTGLEAVIAPGSVVTVGGAVRKDAAGLDLKSLLIGSEGALGIITAAWLRLVPAPEARLPVLATYDSASHGCAAILAVVGSGLQPAVLEYLDAATMEIAGAGLALHGRRAGFTVIAEADGGAEEAGRLRQQLIETMGEAASGVLAPTQPAEVDALWRWRDGVSGTVTAARGRKISEDVAVPIDRLQDVVEHTLALGRRFGVGACSWGHAGDGNVHSSFLFSADDAAAGERARAAAAEIVGDAVALGGTISGEHGVGLTKQTYQRQYRDAQVLELQAAVKRAFDPAGLLNPGKAV